MCVCGKGSLCVCVCACVCVSQVLWPIRKGELFRTEEKDKESHHAGSYTFKNTSDRRWSFSEQKQTLFSQ